MDFGKSLFGPMIEAAEPLMEIGPRLLAFLAIILAGLLFAYLFKRLVTFIARLLGFDVLSYRIGLTSLLTRIWYDQTAAETVGRIAYWLILLFHLLLGVSVLHVETLNGLVAKVIAWIPLFAVALVVIVAGYFIARFLGTAALIALVNAQYKSASLIAFLVRTIILVFFVAVAAEHLCVGRSIVVATFVITLGGIILALAIALGLGGREMAKEFLEKKLRSLEEKARGTDEISHV